MDRQGRWMMRFSIRNLVLAITALAIAWHVFQCHYRPYRLVKNLRECGAEVEFDRENLSWFTQCLGSVLPESSVLTVKSVRFKLLTKPSNLFRGSPQRFDYSRLRQLKLLQELELTGSFVDDELFQHRDFAFLDHMQHLKTLKMNFASIDTLKMEAIVRHKSLDTVMFSACRFRQLDKPPEPKKGINSRLQVIGITMVNTGTHLIEWLNQFQSLRELRIGSIALIASAPITDDDLDRLAPSTKLQLFYYFVESGITPDQHKALQEKYPNARLDVSVSDLRKGIRF